MGRDATAILFYGMPIPKSDDPDEPGFYSMERSVYLDGIGMNKDDPKARDAIDKCKFEIIIGGYDENLQEYVALKSSVHRSDVCDDTELPSDLNEIDGVIRGSQLDDELKEYCDIMGIPFDESKCSWRLICLYF